MAATQSFLARLILQHIPDTGSAAEKEFDEELTLSGFDSLTPGQRLKLSNSATDQAVTFTDAIGVWIFSHDNPFDWRLAAGETLVENARLLFMMADDTDDGLHQISILLTGNTANDSNLEIWLIEKP